MRVSTPLLQKWTFYCIWRLSADMLGTLLSARRNSMRALIMPHTPMAQSSDIQFGREILAKKAIPARKKKTRASYARAPRGCIFIRLADIPVSRGWSGGDFCGHEYEMIDVAQAESGSRTRIISGRAVAALIIDERERESERAAHSCSFSSSGFDPGPSRRITRGAI